MQYQMSGKTPGGAVTTTGSQLSMQQQQSIKKLNNQQLFTMGGSALPGQGNKATYSTAPSHAMSGPANS